MGTAWTFGNFLALGLINPPLESLLILAYTA